MLINQDRLQKPLQHKKSENKKNGKGFYGAKKPKNLTKSKIK